MHRRTLSRPLSRTAALVVALLLAAGTLLALPAGPAHAVADRDCGDFATQADAQRFYVNAGGPRVDPHRLDSEGDGVACESLPCPCSTKTTGPKPPAATGPKTVVQYGRVIRVVDGDTVKVRLNVGRRVTVQYVGATAPVRAACGGPAAARSLTKVLPRNTRVKLVSDPRRALRDGQGRLLRYVMKGSTDTARLQVNRGHARVQVKTFTRKPSYVTAQRGAKAADRGLWGRC